MEKRPGGVVGGAEGPIFCTLAGSVYTYLGSVSLAYRMLKQDRRTMHESESTDDLQVFHPQPQKGQREKEEHK